jgi:hypothetical protein
MTSTPPQGPMPWRILFWLVPLAVVIIGYCVTDPAGVWTKLLWLAGAAALGLVSGFTTGASSQTGAGAELLKFISGGILVPLLSGVVAILQYRQGSKEHYQYMGDHLVEKTTEATVPTDFAYFHPLWVLALFFVGYCSFAVIGVMLGQALQAAGFSIKVTRV